MPPETLTRRQVLRSFGLLGGSSLMMGAMGSWDLMGPASRPRPVLRGLQPDTRILILGGGLSGLVVGYELGKLDYDYRILEARDWPGGLCWTVRRGSTHTEIGGETQVCDFDEGQYLNAGAWRIPNADRSVLDYCKELGVELEVFIDHSNANYFYEEGEDVGPLAGQRVRLREVRADLWGSTSELLTKAMNEGRIDVPVSEDDKERLVDFLVIAGYLDSEDQVYRPPESRGSESRYDLSALLRSGFGSRARSLYEGIGGPAPVFQPVGGMDRIPNAFAREVGDRLTTGAEVQSIHQTDDEVRVVYRDRRTGEEHEARADYCVCCLPLSIMKGLDVDLSPDMAQAVADSDHSTSAKLGLQMGRRFWEEDDGIFGGHLWSRSLELGEFSYPCNGYFTQKGVLLGYYGNGERADLHEQAVAARVEHVLAQASKVHPQMRPEFEGAYAVWWTRVPYSEGAYGRTPSEERQAQFARADGRLYLGSAGTGPRPAWLEGAIQAAWRTVEAIHGRVVQG